MKSTVAFEQGKSTVLNRAYGSSFENGVWTQTDQSLTSAVLGDGGIYTSTMEMTKWIKALWSYKLISPEMQKNAWSRKKLDNGKMIDYGYGWHLEKVKNNTIREHGGSIFGFKSMGVYEPEEDLYVIGLSNCDCNSPTTITTAIASLLIN